MLREIEIDPYNFELYRFKVGAFYETQCVCVAMRRMENKIDNEIILDDQRQCLVELNTHYSHFTDNLHRSHDWWKTPISVLNQSRG